MTTPHRPPGDTPQRPHGPLASGIVTLAGTPDDASDIDTHLVTIARLAADTLPPVTYASITAVRDGNHSTVAASSELAIAVDQAQYADQSGPCIDALQGTPVGVDNIAATMRWPGFRGQAARIGLKASLSVPLFAGSGTTIAVLNLYGHDPVTMIPLTARVWAVYDNDPVPDRDPDVPPMDAAGEDLIIGLEAAFEVRAVIQRAIGVLMAEQRCTSEDAYLVLRGRAARAGISLEEIADVLRPDLPRQGGDAGG